MEKYAVKVNDKEFIVEFDSVANVNSIKEVIVNGEKKNIDVNMDTLCSLVIDNNTHKINGVFDYNGEPVRFLIGKDYLHVEIEPYLPITKAANKKSSKKSGQVMAPMPGKIVSIDVKPGDLIKKGQDILILEAMKMENRIKSPVDGVVKSVNVREGTTCNYRDLLIVIE
jgi:biotin carboxyl carrier protein